MTVWVIETCVLEDARCDEFRGAFAEQGLRAVFVLDADHAEDARALPPVGARGIVAYGSKSVIPLAARRAWLPGVWTSSDFDFDRAQDGLGEWFLNADAIAAPLAGVEAAAKARGWNQFFVRPATDDKSFAGMVSALSEFPAWRKRMLDSGYLESTDVPAIIASPKRLRREWRLVVAQSDVVASSLYREGGEKRVESGCPDHVVAFGQRGAERYTPAPVFVMDVAESHDGALLIVELNTFNSADLYACDIPAVVAAVTAAGGDS